MPKNILFVENEEKYRTPLREFLEKENYLVSVVATKEEAISILEKTSFDLLLVNMNLGIFLDHSGEGVLDHALKRYPQMPRVLITGAGDAFLGTAQLEKLTEYFTRYKLAEFVRKGPDLDITRLGQRIAQIISDRGSSLPLNPNRQIEGKPYRVNPGANWDILSYLMRCNALESLFKDVTNYQDLIYILLAGSQPDERYVAAYQLWKGLWLKEPGLPYFDMINLLIERESDGSFYKGYRDHVIHSIIVYLLGLYLYYGNKSIRDAMALEFPKSPDFFTAWKIAALFHDIGYIWNIDRKNEVIEQYLIKKLQDYFRYPLHIYCQARNLSLSEQDERKLRIRADARLREIDNLRELRHSYDSPDIYPLDKLDDLLRGVRLVPDQLSQVLWRYDYFTKNTPMPEVGYPVEDHGVLSALLLLAQYEYFESYVRKVCPKGVAEPTISKEVKEIFEKLILQVDRYRLQVHHAAAAIALHNINVDIWNIDDAKETPYCLTLDSYQLSLKELPLAFLLALTDALQCWDRPLRTQAPLALKDCAWQSPDVRILCEDEMIKLCFLKDPDYMRCTPDSRAGKMLREMGHYLNSDDLSVLVEVKEV